MKTFWKILLCLSIVVARYNACAQNNDDARALIKEGQQLNDEKKYAEAIEKYSQALKIDTGNLFADYQMASSLFNLDRGKEGIPYLQKVIRSGNSLTAAADDLSGLIYFRAKQYSEAEKCAIDAIKLDPKHAGSQRMYALVAFHQNKRAEALLGFCSFILLEPQTARSAEAYGNIQHILQGGTLKPEPGVVIQPLDADNTALNLAITKAVAEAGKTKYNTAADALTAQLTKIFIIVGQLSEKQTGNDFFRNYLAAYFYKLAQSPNMTAFAREISLSLPESAAWAKEHAQQMADLEGWVKGTARGF
jgi:tetratricopeptide (TPR) repeat protein